MSQSQTYRSVGRRKEAIARVILKSGSGKRMVNKREFTEYFRNSLSEKIIAQPFSLLNCGDKWDVTVNVRGGGVSGQAGAIRLGIARALVNSNEENKKALRAAGYLTRDSRTVQRKHYGRAKARKRFQFSKR